jgi:hypothetical protein
VIRCYQCVSFTYQGQSPNNTNTPVGVCEEYAGTEFYVQFLGTAGACEKFRLRRHGNRCPTCARPMPVPKE